MLTDFGVTYSHLLFYVPTEVSAALELIIIKDSLFAHTFVLSRGRVVGQLTGIMMMTRKFHKKVTLCRQQHYIIVLHYVVTLQVFECLQRKGMRITFRCQERNSRGNRSFIMFKQIYCVVNCLLWMSLSRP